MAGERAGPVTRIFRLVRGHAGITTRAVAVRTGLSVSEAGRVLQKMRRRGLVEGERTTAPATPGTVNVWRVEEGARL